MTKIKEVRVQYEQKWAKASVTSVLGGYHRTFEHKKGRLKHRCLKKSSGAATVVDSMCRRLPPTYLLADYRELFGQTQNSVMDVDDGHMKSKAHLLPVDRDGNYPAAPRDWYEETQSKLVSRFACRRQICLWTAHTTLILIYTTVFACSFRFSTDIAGSDSTSLRLPAQSALQREIRYFPTALRNNAFTGEPRPELDEAWHDLVRNDNIHVPASEITRFNLSSIELADGSGVVAQLGVFHALHCLKMIRHFIYKDHYLANATEHAIWKMGVHVDHCVEYIRENLMCHPDISFVTHRWITTNEGLRPSNKDQSPHECVNWDALNEWSGKRVFDLYQLHLLKQPPFP